MLAKKERSVRKTKIIATLGPASRSPEKLRELIRAGTNVFRLNFSHGSHAEHLETLHRVRDASNELEMPVAVLQDLSGPKIRITPIEGDFAPLSDGDHVELVFSDGTKSTSARIYVEGVNPTIVLKPGHPVLLADGIIELRAVEISGKVARCTVVKGGRIRSRVGIAFPDSNVDLPATTDKDMEDLAWGIEHGVDYVALSFVNNGDDMRLVKKVISEKKGFQKVISKIERKSALDNIDDILKESDGLMVARGDLGLEFPPEHVPVIQKSLIEMCNYRGIPVIVATQMLQSMVTSIRPTRAEVSDVATAVMQGADAIMLSEETTIGEHPVECVNYLSRIAHQAEQGFLFEEFKLRLRDADRATVPDAVAYAACAAAVKVQGSAIIACTETGYSARLVAKYRPQLALYGASSSATTLRRMCLYWGVIPISCVTPSSHLDEVEIALRTVQTNEDLPNGARAVLTGGLSVRTPGATSVLEIREMNYR